MNPEFGWTKEMIDVIKDCEIDNCFPIIIKIQDNYYEFSDKEYDEEYNFTATSPISYEGILVAHIVMTILMVIMMQININFGNVYI